MTSRYQSYSYFTFLGTTIYDMSSSFTPVIYKLSLLPLEYIIIFFLTLIVFKGGVNSVFGYILFILLLSYFLVTKQLFLYAFIFLLLSVVVMIMLSVVMSVSPISTSFTFRKTSFLAVVIVVFSYLNYVTVVPSELCVSQSSMHFILDNLLFSVWFSFLASSCFFIWVKIAPQFIQFTFSLDSLHKLPFKKTNKDMYLMFSFFSSFTTDLSFLFILGIILFALPGAIKNYFARTSISSNSVYLLRGNRWREELERWSADVYECGISADVIQLKNNPNFLRFIILAGFFIILDIEVVFIALLFITSNYNILALLIATALVKLLALMNVMTNRS